MKLDLNQYQKFNKLQEKTFVQLKNGDTGEPETTESGEQIGFTLYSSASDKYKRAIRATTHMDLSKDEKKRKKEIEKKAESQETLRDEELDFLDYCDKTTIQRLQYVYSMLVVEIHNIELDPEQAKQIGVKVDKSGAIVCNPDNLHKLFVAVPDLSAQIGDGINTMANFTKS